MYSSNHNRGKSFEEFRREIQETTTELTNDIKEEHRLEAEVSTLKQTLKEDERKIIHLKEEIRELEKEKLAEGRELAQLEQENRTQINEHLSDKSKMIRPHLN